MKNVKIVLCTALLVLMASCTTDLEIDQNEEILLTQNDSIVCVMDVSPAFSFNAFIKDDVILEDGDSEGSIALGGDLTINGTFTVATQTAGSFFDADEDLASALVVGGQLVYQSSEGIKVNQGFVKVGDLSGSTVFDVDNNNVVTNTRITPGDFEQTPRVLLQRNQVLESVDAPGVIDFEAAFETFNEASLFASTFENNVTIEEGNKITLVDTVNVLNIAGAELNNLVNFTFNNQPSINSPLLINVDAPGDFVWTVQNQAGIGDQNGAHIAYNFFNSTQITIASGTSIIGTLFAPSALVIKESSDNINGQVIAQSYIHMNGELHQHPLEYCVEIETDEEIVLEDG